MSIIPTSIGARSPTVCHMAFAANLFAAPRSGLAMTTPIFWSMSGMTVEARRNDSWSSVLAASMAIQVARSGDFAT